MASFRFAVPPVSRVETGRGEVGEVLPGKRARLWILDKPGGYNAVAFSLYSPNRVVVLFF